jgi:ferric-dicitrate binding protein FerR (iron transport regulator)
MELKYVTYSLDELLEDKPFIAWVLRGVKNREWEEFLKKHPEFAPKAKKAREIILLFRDTYDVLDEESVLKMWQNIESFEHLHRQKIRKIKIRTIMARAASVLLVLSLGTLAYLYWGEKESGYHFAEQNREYSASEARLVLNGGEEIALQKDNSTIAINDLNKQVIVNDSIIDISQTTPKNNETAMNEVIIPYGKRSELLLADGTKVWLNAGSRLAFPSQFNGESREVFLEGEACFKVARKESQPFVVNAGQLGITVLGTHFNVAAYPADQTIETVLIEGSVAVSRPKTFGLGKEEVLLKPSQKASFDKKNREVVVSDEPEAEVYIAWTEGWMQFSKESLISVFSKLERYYNIQIITPENFPSAELITGKLDLKDSLDEVLVALADVAKIDYRINGDTVYIDKKVNEMRKR